MSAETYAALIAAPQRDRLNLFLETANRLGAPVGNVEKDFWVCWTLDALYHRLPPGGPRLLFKGGTSLSKSFGLIQRFSEDIDITVFRDDLDQAASVEDLEALSGRKRDARLDDIRAACRAYVTGPLRDALQALVGHATAGAGRVEIDPEDPDGQTLLVWYPEVEPRDDAYVRPAVRIESGAKSALDPNEPTTVIPYIAHEVENLGLAVPGITTIRSTRTFWDKVVIAHGLRRWFDRRGVLRQEGQRVSRHYYDLHCLAASDTGAAAIADPMLGRDCVRHARMFFNRPDFDLEGARPPTYARSPHDGMIDRLRRDYAAMSAMIFGPVPDFDEVLASVGRIEALINTAPA